MKQSDPDKFSEKQYHVENPILAPLIGRLADPGKSGEIMVVFQDNSPKPARLLSSINSARLYKAENIGREVLIVFEGGDPKLPIIIGLLENMLEDIVLLKIDQTQTTQKRPREARMDGKRVVLEAEKEIQLKCGKGSITIKKNGKIVVKGTDLLSRSSGTNRIKGTSVGIN